MIKKAELEAQLAAKTAECIQLVEEAKKEQKRLSDMYLQLIDESKETEARLSNNAEFVCHPNNFLWHRDADASVSAYVVKGDNADLNDAPKKELICRIPIPDTYDNDLVPNHSDRVDAVFKAVVEAMRDWPEDRVLVEKTFQEWAG